MLRPQKPYKLVTVHPDSNLARQLAERVISEHAEYNIEFVTNCEKIEDVEATLRKHNPDTLFSASVWTPEENNRIIEIAKATIPGIKAHAIPHGLHATQGSNGVVEHAKTVLPDVLDCEKF